MNDFTLKYKRFSSLGGELVEVGSDSLEDLIELSTAIEGISYYWEIVDNQCSLSFLGSQLYVH